MFEPQFEALSARFRCIGLDWRGQGKSEATLGGYDVDNLARDCMALMTHLGVDQFHWVGLSIGGVVGIRMAAEHPSRIKSLFAIGAAADCEPYEKLAKYESLFDKILVEGFEAIRAPMAPIIFGPDFLNDASRVSLKEKWLDIMRKTWKKMSAEAHVFAKNGGVKLPETLQPLILKAVAGG